MHDQRADAELNNATVTGGITSDGAGFITLCGPTIGGAVIIKNTIQMVRVGDDDAVCAGDTVAGLLTGSLSCANDTPAPTNDTLPNTAGGTKLGQCANL